MTPQPCIHSFVCILSGIVPNDCYRITCEQYCSRPAPQQSEMISKDLALDLMMAARKEAAEQARREERERLLNAVSSGLQKNTYYNGVTWCVSNDDISRVLELSRNC